MMTMMLMMMAMLMMAPMKELKTAELMLMMPFFIALHFPSQSRRINGTRQGLYPSNEANTTTGSRQTCT